MTFYCVMSSFKDNGDSWAGIVERREADTKPDSAFKSTKRADIYTDWFESYEEALAFVYAGRKA